VEEGEGFTKDVKLNASEIEKVIKKIEASTNTRKMISLEQA
jgi:hypothetical protein